MTEPTAKQHGPFPDANTFPYPRLCVPTLRDHYPSCGLDCMGHTEYTYYEKERVTVGDKEFLVWKEIKSATNS